MKECSGEKPTISAVLRPQRGDLVVVEAGLDVDIKVSQDLIDRFRKGVLHRKGARGAQRVAAFGERGPQRIGMAVVLALKFSRWEGLVLLLGRISRLDSGTWKKVK